MSMQRFFPATRESAEEIKRRAFRYEGILVASVDDPRLDWVQRETLKQVGVKLYGPPRRGDSRNPPGHPNPAGSIS